MKRVILLLLFVSALLTLGVTIAGRAGDALYVYLPMVATGQPRRTPVEITGAWLEVTGDIYNVVHVTGTAPICHVPVYDMHSTEMGGETYIDIWAEFTDCCPLDPIWALDFEVRWTQTVFVNGVETTP